MYILYATGNKRIAIVKSYYSLKSTSLNTITDNFLYNSNQLKIITVMYEIVTVEICKLLYIHYQLQQQLQ